MTQNLFPLTSLNNKKLSRRAKLWKPMHSNSAPPFPTHLNEHTHAWACTHTHPPNNYWKYTNAHTHEQAHTPIRTCTCTLLHTQPTCLTQEGHLQSPLGTSGRGGMRQYVWKASSQPSHSSMNSSPSPRVHTPQWYLSTCVSSWRHHG